MNFIIIIKVYQHEFSGWANNALLGLQPKALLGFFGPSSSHCWLVVFSVAKHPIIETAKRVTSQDESESWYALVWLFLAHHSIGLTFRNLMIPG